MREGMVSAEVGEELCALTGSNSTFKRSCLMTINNQNTQYSEWDIEVAKRIACAVVSYQAGLTYEDMWKQYADQAEEIGTFWLSLARQIREGLPNKPK